MKKEVILAICIGLLIGGIITFGMYRAKLAVDSASPAPEFVPLVTPQPTPSSPTVAQITLKEPKDEMLVRNSTVRVTGITTPQSVVVIFQGDLEIITSADQEGNFSTTITLNPGGNILVIRSIADDGTVQETTRTLVFSTADFFDVPESKTATSSTKKQQSL